jgi:hypothetical protein
MRLALLCEAPRSAMRQPDAATSTRCYVLYVDVNPRPQAPPISYLLSAPWLVAWRLAAGWRLAGGCGWWARSVLSQCQCQCQGAGVEG